MKKTLLFAAGLALASLPASAQMLQSTTSGEAYITWPSSSSLHTYIQAWNGGNGTITINGKEWEDENFFISRVKPKTRYYNVATQVYPGITQWSTSNKSGTDKRLCYWVPVGDLARKGQSLNALPDGSFDGDVFSMWNYIDHYGNWTSPYGWVPGAFADVAHKNGVAVSGVASVPYGGISSEWKTEFQYMTANNNTFNADVVGKFLYYHGVDGLGYNSEWSGYSPSGLTTLHNGLQTYMADKNPIWENMWYAGTTDSGSIGFDRGLSDMHSLYNSVSAFLNYNWNNTSTMSTSISYSEGISKSPFYIYAGMNMQGGEPKSGDNYNLLKDYKYSIGLWGAHQNSMFWQDRFGSGSSGQAKAAYYQLELEKWFTNAKRNPALKMDIKLNRSHRPTDDWAGMSSMMTARTTLNWNPKTDEPFYSYFNLGNGTFFNWKGDRMNSNEWYNLGVQDYLPTWRFWWAPTWLGGRTTTFSESDLHMDAVFTWEDAYVGGSCLKISGTATSEYLHIFKTNFPISASDTKIRVIYKILGGNADIDLSLNANSGTTERSVKLVDKAGCEDVIDRAFLDGAEGWTVAELSVPSVRGFSQLGVIGLHFKNAENLEMLLGGIEVDRGTTWEAPAQPTLTKTKMLAYNKYGVDAKLIWTMNPNNTVKAVGEPCYNSDVKTSMFRMWSQQEGEEKVNVGMTTSWAGIAFAAPVDSKGQGRIRFGVSALSMDTKNESEIAWSEYLTLPDYVTIEDVEVSKSIIKPGEDFVMSFADDKHSTGTWTLRDDAGNTVWTGSGISVECPGLPGIGAYDLVLQTNGETVEYPRFISISSEAVGALPQIYSLAIDDNSTDGVELVEITKNETKTFTYTGRSADGSSSRGIDLNENWFGVPCSEIGLTSHRSFSVAAWVKYNELPSGRSNFITVEDRINGGWPYDNWGYFWSRVNDEGRFIYDGVDTAWGWRTQGNDTEGGRIFYRYADTKIDVNAWVHVAIAFEYKTGTKEMRSRFYVNGKLQKVTEWGAGLKSSFEKQVGQTDAEGKMEWSNIARLAKAAGLSYGFETYQPDYMEHNYPVTNGTWITFGGSSQNISAVKGCVDDFQVWGKAMDENDVKLSMEGLDKNNLPADVLGYWDFETDAASDKGFVGAAGANATAKSPKAYWYKIASAGEGKNTRSTDLPPYLVGCPFIAGTAYPVVTKPTWSTRRADVKGNGTGTSGSADITWTKPGDYAVTLTLANGHGETSKDYPVVVVKDDTQAIEGIGQDTDGFSTYTIDDALFVEFDGDGVYDIEVYNMAGMKVGGKSVDAVSGQNASIRLGAAGVYLVKVGRDGQLLRTVKVIRN